MKKSDARRGELLALVTVCIKSATRFKKIEQRLKLYNQTGDMTISDRQPMDKTMRKAGFSLLEISVVLVILGLLMVGGVSSFSTQSTKHHREKNQLYLEKIRDSLIWYAKSRGRLPCPDTDADGMGNDNGAACTALVGILPWKELGSPNVEGVDAWGNYFTYHIGESYSLQTIALETGTNSDSFCNIASNGHCLIGVNDVDGVPLANDAPAIIVSHGKNGEGHFLINVAPLVQDPSNLNAIANITERENANGSEENADPAKDIVYTRGAGDDMMLWLSPAALKSQP